MRKSALAAVVAVALTFSSAFAETILPNRSYDLTHELEKDFNAACNKHGLGTTGQSVDVRPSYAGSGKQAMAVLDSPEADVVTLARAYDIDAPVVRKLIPADGQKHLPNNSSPYSSTLGERHAAD